MNANIVFTKFARSYMELKKDLPIRPSEMAVQNDDEFFAHYVDKRFCVTGVAKKVGPDIHNKPSIELSDMASGKTYALVIFPTDEHYSRVQVGDTVTVCANYLVMSNLFSTVMKYSELVSVKNENS